MKIPILLTCGWLAAAGCASLRAADATPVQTDAYQDGVEQESLRAQTRRARKNLLAILDAFQAYPGLAPELAQVRRAAQNLDDLSGKDMTDAVKALREANRAGDAAEAKDHLLAASRDQKNIQAVLRQLADELASQRDEAAVHRRIMDLVLRQMTQQHQTGRLADGTVPSWELERATKLAVEEQGAIREEVTQVLAVLEKPIQTSGQPASAAASSVGANTRVAVQTDAVLADFAAKKLPEAIADQGAVINGLETMLLALDAARPLPERIGSMAGRMKELAAREDRLIDTTLVIFFTGQYQIADAQEHIGDEAAAISLKIARLSAPAAGELDKAQQAIRLIADSFKAGNFLEKEDKRLEIVTCQRNASASFTQTAILLQRQADAQTAGSQSPIQPAPDNRQAAIQDVANLIVKARDQLRTASQLAGRSTSPDTSKSLVNQARQELSQAAAKVSAPDSGVDGAAVAKLKRADGEIAEAEPKIGTAANQEYNSWTINAAHEDAGLALAEVQKAANRLTAADANGEATGHDPAANGTSAAASRPGKPGNADTTYSALARFSARDREALSTLSREPVALEYSTMVEQYRKNLADGGMPDQ